MENAEGVIATGEDAQVTQAYDLGIATKLVDELVALEERIGKLNAYIGQGLEQGRRQLYTFTATAIKLLLVLIVYNNLVLLINLKMVFC